MDFFLKKFQQSFSSLLFWPRFPNNASKQGMVSRTTGPQVLRVSGTCIYVQTCVRDQAWPREGFCCLFTALWLDWSIYCTTRCTVMEMWCNNRIMCLVKALLAPNSSPASIPRKDTWRGAPAGSFSLPKQCSVCAVNVCFSLTDGVEYAVLVENAHPPPSQVLSQGQQFILPSPTDPFSLPETHTSADRVSVFLLNLPEPPPLSL